jgi:uncharacterized alpha-E superfamily protein
VLHVMFEAGAFARDDGYDFVLQLFDSTITYRALYQRRLELPPLLDLLVQEPANPRSLRGIARRLDDQIARLGAPGASQLRLLLPEQAQWPDIVRLCATDDAGHYDTLLDLTERLSLGCHALSDAIGARYFSHAAEAFQSVNA